jgi:Zn-dependent M32 family carboxypeptidase
LKSNNIWEDVLINNPEIGNYLIENLFKYGSSLHWKEVIKIATGEALNPKYYNNQYLS